MSKYLLLIFLFICLGLYSPTKQKIVERQYYFHVNSTLLLGNSFPMNVSCKNRKCDFENGCKPINLAYNQLENWLNTNYQSITVYGYIYYTNTTIICLISRIF